jgi:hypothetical protein
MESEEKQTGLKNMVKDVVNHILASSEVDISEIKDEIWKDLSDLYYKYEDEDQKRAFREVMHEISDKIKDGKWENVYRKLYRIGQKDRGF